MKNIRIGLESIITRKTDNTNRYFNELKKFSGTVTRQEEAELIKKAKDGDKAAQDKIIQANLRFVVSIAKHYHVNGVELDDLIQEGNLALFRALDNFDLQRGLKFISYAVDWVRQHLIEYIKAHKQTVRPKNRERFGGAKKINEFRDKFYQKHGRMPLDEEVINFLHTLNKKYGQNNYYCGTNPKPCDISPFSINSMDAPIGTDGESTLKDIISLTANDSNKLDIETLYKALRKLKPSDQELICGKFGLWGHACKTNLQVAADIGVSKQTVADRLERALCKLRRILKNVPLY